MSKLSVGIHRTYLHN